jgi:acyl-CoA thioesterase
MITIIVPDYAAGAPADSLASAYGPTLRHTAGVDAQDPAQELADRCAGEMWAADRASRSLGMTTPEVSPGRARITMPVRADMANGQGICHGGIIATLADSAFAFACNTHDDVTVAAGFDVVFVSPGRVGDVLIADAVERARFGRSGLYDVAVTRADGTLVAEFRGRSRSLGRPLLG